MMQKLLTTLLLILLIASPANAISLLDLQLASIDEPSVENPVNRLDVKSCVLCLSEGDVKTLNASVEKLKFSLDRCKDAVKSQLSLNKEAVDLLDNCEKREAVHLKLDLQRTEQLEEASKRISELEDGSWYEVIFYYVIPMLFIGTATYTTVDIIN